MELKSETRNDLLNHEIKTLLEKLTHSGKDYLSKNELKRIQEICSLSENNVQFIYNEVFKMLKKKHSEIVLSSVQLCDELLRNNVQFRHLFIENVREFLKLIFDTPLPPPKIGATKILKCAITCMDSWHTKFGKQYYKLDAAYKYLKKKNIDFEMKEIVDPKKRMEDREKEAKAMLRYRQHLNKSTTEMEDLKAEIEEAITSLECCFNMLLPKPEDFIEDELGNIDNDESDNVEMRLFGIIDPRHTVQLEIDECQKIEIVENEENAVILSAAKEAFNLIYKRFLPKTKAWLELINKVNDTSKEGFIMKKLAQKQELMLTSLVNRYNMLKIIPSQDVETNESSDDDDLEEVVLPKPDRKIQQEEEISFLFDSSKNSKEEPDNDLDETLTKNENHHIQENSTCNGNMSDRKRELLTVAPKLPYDIDLYHWEDETLPTPTILPVSCEGAKFWSGGTSEDISELPLPGGSSVLRTRVIEFSGKFEPVERSCRVLLPSGKLCPRRDRIKCPFHGLIVDRDDKGHVVNEKDKEKVVCKPTTPDWQDPKLLAEIKASTGIDLKMPEKGKRNRRLKHPGLTDLNAVKKTSKARLSKKIFNKASTKRVAAVLNNLDYKKHRDKFGDQFNYFHNH